MANVEGIWGKVFERGPFDFPNSFSGIFSAEVSKAIKTVHFLKNDLKNAKIKNA